MRALLLSIISCSFIYTTYSQSLNNWSKEKIVVKKESNVSTIMHAEDIFKDRWDILAQTQFWKQIMVLSPDSCIINVGNTRQVLLKVSNKDWNSKTELEKDEFKAALKKEYNLPEESLINVTIGKSDFYRFKDVYPSISKGVAAFEKQGVDPWYAQAILLIESPGQLKKSSAGAYGAFQLMPDVARSMGLTVTDKIDERKDFDRCAYGAARLIQKICIPEAKKILDRHQMSYDVNDLWFRLFVLHVYHAGAGNVAAVVAKIQPKEGSQQLILDMWQNKAAKFGNGSQNYTQLALAAQLILHEMIYEQCDEISDFAAR
ncbi:MAG: lytic transglycosylase domain-containing protein [Flavobacteriales bacterium]|nr:lytic transglycosylase domain-containing protein [Flavobacteriales bacterium]